MFIYFFSFHLTSMFFFFSLNACVSERLLLNIEIYNTVYIYILFEHLKNAFKFERAAINHRRLIVYAKVLQSNTDIIFIVSDTVRYVTKDSGGCKHGISQ